MVRFLHFIKLDEHFTLFYNVELSEVKPAAVSDLSTATREFNRFSTADPPSFCNLPLLRQIMRPAKRRLFLKSATAALSLPALETFAKTSKKERNHANCTRFVAIGSNLGYHGPAFFPKDTGSDYVTSELLQHIDKHRSGYTVFSGFDHRAANGHKNWDNFLCGTRIGSFSLDQQIAKQVGQRTDLPSMQLCAGEIPAQKMCFNERGTPLPMLNRPSVVYEKLFGRAKNPEHNEYLLKSGLSVIDSLTQEARMVQTAVSAADRRKLEEYFTSLRELEKRMGKQLLYLADDQVKVDYELPPYDPVTPTLMLECEQIMLDLIHLALQTDTTRVASLFIAGLGQVFTIDGRTLRAGYHALSHHGNDPDLIRDLVRVETEHMRCFDRFLKKMKETTDAAGRPLLETTVILIGTGMGDASRHSNRNLPTIVAGGGLKHGKHIASDPKQDDALLLGDVYLSILGQFGIDADEFSGASRGIANW